MQRSRLLASSLLLIMAACGDLPIVGLTEADDTSGTSGDDAWPCVCDPDNDGQANPGTCAPENTCGIVCPVGEESCPAGIMSGVAVCFEPCAVGTVKLGCDCQPFTPTSDLGYCFNPPACIGD